MQEFRLSLGPWFRQSFRLISFFFVQTGALLLDGPGIKYFGANIPLNLAAAVILELVLVGGAEYYRATNDSPLGSVSWCNLDDLQFSVNISPST